MFPVSKQETQILSGQTVILKPQDTLLVLKYWSIKGLVLNALQVSPDQVAESGRTAPEEISKKPSKKPSVRQLAESIQISPGEISKSTQRLVAAKLVIEREGEYLAEKSALLDWLCYGVRHAYPIEIIGYGRGMPTAWNCPLVKTDIMPPEPPIVWAVSGGSVEGSMIKPSHASIPFAASNDDLLYEALSLVEAIRMGKPRELAVAREALSILIESYKRQ